MMTDFSTVYAALRRRNRGQYALLAGCCFFSVLLITAYVCVMRAPTVLAVLPEGGDSRKQVMMIFALAAVGCAVFTTYAAGLFFREKSRETGVFLALGATRSQLRRALFRELAVLAFGACAAGAALGAPLAWLLWQVFRLCVVDSAEMALTFDPRAMLLALAFCLYVAAVLFLLGGRSVARTDVIGVLHESHKSEPIRAVPRWYGWGGVLLLGLGGFLGYSVPSFCVLVLHWYAPEGLTAVFYLPALAGLYMILLHTVVNGWGRRRHRYRDLIATSMMKFQGRQTVRSMLVMTLLIAGAYFASFYAPMLGAGAMLSYDARPVDYAYHWRADQDIPQEDEVRALAERYGVTITSWTQAGMARLAVDGYASVEHEGALGVTWEEEYRERLCSDLFLSESAYTALTGEALDLAPGEIAGVMDAQGEGQGVFGGTATLVTNCATGEAWPVTTVEPLRNDLLFGRFVADDGDYARMTAGLTADWRETQVFFNVQNCADTYDFARALFNGIVDRSTPAVALFDAWDPVVREQEIAQNGYYWCDPEYLEENGLDDIDYAERDSSDFRLYWQYMPRFRVLDKADFVRTMAVFLVLFVFIAVVCFAAVFVIAFTRCATIALLNRQVYDDLRRLGAPDAYLRRSARGQVSRVFLVPALAGTGLIYAFYTMILYFNGSPAGISPGEAAGMLACLAIIAAVSLLQYAVYRLTLRRVCKTLSIG